MTELHLFLFSGSLFVICAVVTYLITHDSKNIKKDKSIKH
jgi:hypothetical protein